MRSLFSFLLIYLIIKLVILGVGAAVGFLLHWLLPEVNLGTALLTGVVATGLSTHFFIRLMAVVQDFEADEHEERRPITLFAIEPPRTPRRRRKKS
jgi:hypothetical protein